MKKKELSELLAGEKKKELSELLAGEELLVVVHQRYNEGRQ